MKKGWVRKERKEKGEIYWGRDRGKGKKREKWKEEGKRGGKGNGSGIGKEKEDG